jgi:hypothetical protein
MENLRFFSRKSEPQKVINSSLKKKIIPYINEHIKKNENC